MAADLRLGQPYRAQLTVTVGGEAAWRERLPATWRCSPCKAAPEGLVMVTPEQSISHRRRSTRESWTPRDIRPSVRSSSAYSASFGGMGQKAPSQRQARQASGLDGDAFIQQTVKQSQLDGRGQIVHLKTTAEAGATQAQIGLRFQS